MKKLTLIAALALVLGACSSSPETSETEMSTTSTSPPANQAETSPEEVALSFLAARETHDIDAALALIDDDAVVDVGPAGSKDALAFEMAFGAATGLVAAPVACEGAAGVLTCRAEYTTAITRARELAPETLTYDIEVTGDRITSVHLVDLGSYSSNDWEPFQAWITQSHPDDFKVMYDGASSIAISDEALDLWETHTNEYVDHLEMAPEAMAAVESAFAARSAGDIDAYLDALGGEERAGVLTWRSQLEADAVAHWEISFPNGCGHERLGANGTHVVRCFAVTTSDFYEAMGIVEEGDDLFYVDGDLKIVRWDSFNETNDPGEHDAELVRWLYAEHPEVAADMTAGPSTWWERTPEDMAIVLGYLEEFVAQSDTYPITP